MTVSKETFYSRTSIAQSLPIRISAKIRCVHLALQQRKSYRPQGSNYTRHSLSI